MKSQCLYKGLVSRVNMFTCLIRRLCVFSVKYGARLPCGKAVLGYTPLQYRSVPHMHAKAMYLNQAFRYAKHRIVILNWLLIYVLGWASVLFERFVSHWVTSLPTLPIILRLESQGIADFRFHSLPLLHFADLKPKMERVLPRVTQHLTYILYLTSDHLLSLS